MVGVGTQKSTTLQKGGKLANLTRNDSDMTFEPSVTKGKRKDKTLYLKEPEGQMCFFLRNQSSFL